jgi:hypothetical protein
VKPHPLSLPGYGSYLVSMAHSPGGACHRSLLDVDEGYQLKSGDLRRVHGAILISPSPPSVADFAHQPAYAACSTAIACRREPARLLIARLVIRLSEPKIPRIPLHRR